MANVKLVFLSLQIELLNKKPFWILRLLICIYVLASFVVAATYIKSATIWVIYLTSINHIIVTIYFISSSLISSYHIWRSRAIGSSPIMEEEGLAPNSPPSQQPQGRLMKSYLKFHWLLFNLSINICSFVFLSYWILVYPNDENIFKNSTLTFLTIDRHGINLLLLLVEQLISQTPIRILHFVYPAGLLLLYFISNMIYWATTKKLIYGKVLDYGNNTALAVVMVTIAIVIAAPIIHLCWFSLSHLFERMFQKCQQKKDNLTTYDADFDGNL